MFWKRSSSGSALSVIDDTQMIRFEANYSPYMVISFQLILDDFYHILIGLRMQEKVWALMEGKNGVPSIEKSQT